MTRAETQVSATYERKAPSELFLDTCIPPIQENESIYSWCARFHRLNGGCDARATSKMLFGDASAGLRHDFPLHMENFHVITRGRLGPPEELLRSRTLFGFHAPFLPALVEVEVQNHLLSSETPHARRKLGLSRAGMRIINPLKLCPHCVAEQLHEQGFSWWRTTHQLPSSFVCNIHQAWLAVIFAPQRRGVMEDFYLPDKLPAKKLPGNHRPSQLNRVQVAKVSEWGCYLWGSSNLHLTDTLLRYCYLLKAKEKGWIAFDGTVRMHQLRDAFISCYLGTLQLFDEEFLGDIGGVNAGFLAHLFRLIPGQRHPLKHILAMNFLFEAPEELFTLYQKIKGLNNQEGEGAVQKLLHDRQGLLLRLVTDGQSVNSAAKAAGVSVTSATRHLDKVGLNERERRPHIIGTEKEQRLREMLCQGISRREIALAVGVRLPFIKDYLATRPEMKSCWAKMHRCRELVRHREQLLTALHQHPELPIKSIRRLPDNGFQWLYNNDREWLLEELPAIWKRPDCSTMNNSLVS